MLNLAHTRPHIVVLGNHKGGSGKSTLSMHIIIAFLKAGRRIASIDLDYEQQSLTRYVNNRREWAQANQITLDLPDHYSIEDLKPSGAPWDDHGRISTLITILGALERNQDLIIIDTAGGSGHLSLFAHGLADTLITPINDSFVDLDVIYTPAIGDEGPSPSRYARTVGAALEARRRVTKERTDWVVVRNRLSPLGSRNERDVGLALESIADKAGFRITTGLLERVVYREFFPIGLTAFDSLEASLLDVKPSMSHLLARQEVRTLIASFNLLPEAEDMTQPKHDILVTTEAPELAASKPTPPIRQVMRALLDSISDT